VASTDSRIKYVLQRKSQKLKKKVIMNLFVLNKEKMKIRRFFHYLLYLLC